MALIKRLNHLITADAHAVLDIMEDPHAMLNQSIRDMEVEIQNQQAHLATQNQQLQKLERLDSSLTTDLVQVNQDLDLCLASDNKDLARSLCKKKILNNRQREQIKKSSLELTESTDQLAAMIKDNQSKLDSIRLKSEVLATQRTKSVSSTQTDTHIVSDDDIEIALLNELKARSKK